MCSNSFACRCMHLVAHFVTAVGGWLVTQWFVQHYNTVPKEAYGTTFWDCTVGPGEAIYVPRCSLACPLSCRQTDAQRMLTVDCSPSPQFLPSLDVECTADGDDHLHLH